MAPKIKPPLRVQRQQHRDIIMAWYAQGYSHREIGLMLKPRISAQAVGQHVRREQAKLKHADMIEGGKS